MSSLNSQTVKAGTVYFLLMHFSVFGWYCMNNFTLVWLPYNVFYSWRDASEYFWFVLLFAVACSKLLRPFIFCELSRCLLKVAYLVEQRAIGSQRLDLVISWKRYLISIKFPPTSHSIDTNGQFHWETEMILNGRWNGGYHRGDVNSTNTLTVHVIPSPPLCLPWSCPSW